MDPISIPAHFDGRQILLDEPCELEPNAKLIVTVLPNHDPERESWLHLSADGLHQAYGSIKNRPAILLREFPPYRDFLVCGVSAQFRQEVKGFDEIVLASDPDF